MPQLTQELVSTEKPPPSARQGYLALVWRQFRRDKLAVVGLVFIGLLFAVAICAPLLAADKPVIMRFEGNLSSPLLREILAPIEGAELFLEAFFNYLLVLSAAFLVVLLPLRLFFPKRPWRRAALWIAAGALAVVCLLPFIFTKPVLDKTDYLALFAQETEENWAVFTPIPYGPYSQVAKAFKPANSTHPLGTDRVGRDVLSRIIHGSRVSLSVGFLAVGVYVLIGIIVGSVSGYHGGMIDLLLQRVVEIVICFPTFLLILTIMAFIEKRSIFNVMLVIGLTSWTGVARLVRGQVLQEKSKDYITAAKALGGGSWRIIFRHVIPNSLAPVLVAATFGVAGAILTETGLSFLGFGVSPPTASWGELLNQAQAWPTGYWWLTTFPGVMIFITVTVYNLVGEGLRDALDPRLKI